MNRTTVVLRWLMGLFVVYCVAKTLVGLRWAWGAFGAVLDGRGGRWPGNWEAVFIPSFVFGLLVALALFVLALWIFAQLLQRKCWARIVLLVVGWLSVLSSLSGILWSSHASAIIDRFGGVVPGIDWHGVAQAGLAENTLGLLFWGWLIYVLQIDPDVKKEFLPATPRREVPGV